MEKLKALDILKLCQAVVDDLNTRPIIKDIQDAVIELKSLQEDFKILQDELKEANEAYLILLKQYHALNEPKTNSSCETCKHYHLDDCHVKRIVTTNDGITCVGIIEVEADGFCNYYEPKL